MIVMNKEKRIVILGDGVRVGRKPPEGTRFDPGAVIRLEDVPDEPRGRRHRFVQCVRAQIEKGLKLEILDAEPAEGMTVAKLEDLQKAKNLEALERLSADVEPPPAPKRGPGRPRKNPPLGG